METDKQTLDNYLVDRSITKDTIVERTIEFKNGLNELENTIHDYDKKISSLTAKYILEILADPNIQEKYGRDANLMTQKEINEKIMEEKPLLTELDIIHGILSLFDEEKITTKTIKGEGIRNYTCIMLKENA